jgi:hypothetical protein
LGPAGNAAAPTSPASGASMPPTRSGISCGARQERGLLLLSASCAASVTSRVCAAVRARASAPRGPCAACPSGLTAPPTRATPGGSRALHPCHGLRRPLALALALARPPPSCRLAGAGCAALRRRRRTCARRDRGSKHGAGKEGRKGGRQGPWRKKGAMRIINNTRALCQLSYQRAPTRTTPPSGDASEQRRVWLATEARRPVRKARCSAARTKLHTRLLL